MSIFDSKPAITGDAEFVKLASVYTKLSILDNTRSSNEKVILLQKYMQDPMFSMVATYALDSRLSFNVKKFPKVKSQYTGTTVAALITHLNFLSSKDGATAPEKAKLFELASYSDDTFEVVKRICNKDLKCGVGVSLVNKAVPNAIFEIPYCRCSTDKKKDNIIYPAVVQEKADGIFDNAIVKSPTDIQFLTRDGKEILQLDRLRESIAKNMHAAFFNNVLQGELRIRDPKTGKLLGRQEGNGIFTSAQFGTADQTLMDNAVLCVWNTVSINDFWTFHESTINYREVLSHLDVLATMFRDAGISCLEIVKTKIVHSYEEAWAFYLGIRAEGGEGAILKNFKLKWRYHTSTDQIKLKNVSSADLVLVDTNDADEDSKYKGMVGALIFESKCGLLRVKVGTGLSDEQRARDWSEDIGTVHEVLYESVSKAKTEKLHSLYLPRYNGPKIDRNKETADSLYDLQNR